MSDHDVLLEHLAAQQWHRMTRSSTPYADLNEHDQRACRALVSPVLADVSDLVAGPVVRATALAAADQAALARARAETVAPLAEHVAAIVDAALTAVSTLLADYPPATPEA